MDRRVNIPDPSMYPSWKEWAAAFSETFSRVLAFTPEDQIPYACVKDVKAQGTAGGTLTTGSWQQRDLTVVQSTLSMARVTTNNLRLSRGRYVCNASVPGYNVGSHQARLYDSTGAAELLLGTSEYAVGVQTASRIVGYFQLTVESVLQLQHYCSSTQAANGCGRALNVTSEVYSVIELWGVQ